MATRLQVTMIVWIKELLKFATINNKPDFVLQIVTNSQQVMGQTPCGSSLDQAACFFNR